MSESSEPVRVLHVEDDAEFAEVVAELLSREDDALVVETATTVRDGLERLAAGGVDCVVSDYDMPGRNGVEFLEAVREEYPDLPFVLFTGKGGEAVASDAISAGATDYLQKGAGTEQYELLANRIRNAVDQYRTRQRAVELDRVRTLARDVNQMLVRAESRSTVERRVCEILSDSDPYLFAWIGGSTDDGRVVPRAAGGVEDGYLEQITITADEAATGQGPGGTAVRERRIAVAQDVTNDPEFEPWREAALERGFRATAAVPLEHADTMYGVLGVYADRPFAFDGDERALLAELGDDVAHALHSLDVRDRLRAERDRRRALFANAPGPVVAGEVEDGVHRITAVNDAFEDVFGYDEVGVTGRDVASVIVPGDERERHEAFRERTEAGEPTVAEVERLTADGVRDFLLTVVPFGADDDAGPGWYAWYTDISDRAERERVIDALHRTTESLLTADTRADIAEVAVEAGRDVLGLSANAVYLAADCGERLEPVAWTDSAEALLGEIPELAPGESLAWEAFETGEPQVYGDVSLEPGRLDPETVVRSEIILPLGDHGVLLASSEVADAFDETTVSLARTLVAHTKTALDLTAREEELDHRQSLFEAVLEASTDGVLVVDDDQARVTWNRTFVDMWGISDPEDRDVDGADALSWVRDRVVDPSAFADAVSVDDEAGAAARREQVSLADGRVLELYTAPVVADDGTDFGRVWFFRDVTARETHERELTRQNERLEELTSVVSHDLRNPLNVAQGRLELARDRSDDEDLDAAADAVDRSLTLIDDLLSIARGDDAAPDAEPICLAETATGCWHTLATADATLEVDADRTVCAVPSRLKQLLENLMRNAVEHGGAEVTVSVGATPDGFFVADDGAGLPSGDADRLFETGYSTKENGTGFGLDIVAQIADEHGWTVDVAESEGGGARFEVRGVEWAD